MAPVAKPSSIGMSASLENSLGAGRLRVTLGGGEARWARGAYFYRLSAPEGVKVGKFVILDESGF